MLTDKVRALVEVSRSMAGCVHPSLGARARDAILAVEAESAREDAVDHALAMAVLEAVMREVSGGLRLRENEWSVTETEVDGIVADQFSFLDGAKR